MVRQSTRHRDTGPTFGDAIIGNCGAAVLLAKIAWIDFAQSLQHG